MENQTEYISNYYIENLRDPETQPSNSMKSVLADFFGDIRQDEEFEMKEIRKAVNKEAEYDWDRLKNEFQIYLEKELDRHHDGDLDNPENSEPDFGEKNHYRLGYIGTSMGEHNFESMKEVFMTSVVHFEDKESDEEEYIVQIEYLDENKGLEAIEYLLERGQIEKIENMITHAISSRDTERALKAYEKVVEENPNLARNLMDTLIKDQEELEDSLKSLYFQHNPEVFESFRDQLDF